MIDIARVYNSKTLAGGETRYLVDRLWPRGIRKDILQIDGWLRECAPDDDLRRWFGHDPARWEEFRRRYFAQLDEKPDVWQPLLDAARQGDLVLLYAARDEAHNNAVALKEYLEARLK